MTDKDWVSAGRLGVGNLLQNEAEELAPVQRVERIRLDGPKRVYNITVSEHNTCCIGRSHVLIHNRPT